MITIGVTGGVGSGKSEILRYLKSQYKCRILMSDNAAKDLELPGGVLYEPLIGLLEQYAPSGEHEPLVLECGDINKTEMARRIFGNKELLDKVNKLVHPAVNRYILDEIERERKAGRRNSLSWSRRFLWKTDTTGSWIPCGISTAVKSRDSGG